MKIELDQALTLCRLQHLFDSFLRMWWWRKLQNKQLCQWSPFWLPPLPLWITLIYSLISAWCASLLPMRMNTQTHFVTFSWLGYMTTVTRYSGKSLTKRGENTNNNSTFPALLHLYQGKPSTKCHLSSALICINNEEPCLQSILFLHVLSGGLTYRWIIKQGHGRHQQAV